MRPHRWEIVESEKFTQELLQIANDDFRLYDAFIDGVKDRLSRDPHMGERLKPNSNVHIIMGDKELYPVVVYYTFDTSQVFLLSARLQTKGREFTL